jgi:hypothetical protein
MLTTVDNNALSDTEKTNTKMIDCFLVEDEEDIDEEDIDEDDPYGFEPEREQEILLEAFRLDVTDDAAYQPDKDRNNSNMHQIRKRQTMPEDFDERPVDEDIKPNQALFDILNRNFDDLDSFHVPVINRIMTSEEVKICFVAFVLVLTPPLNLLRNIIMTLIVGSKLMMQYQIQMNQLQNGNVAGYFQRKRKKEIIMKKMKNIVTMKSKKNQMIKMKTSIFIFGFHMKLCMLCG